MVRILDLYCGMGGLSLGFALALGGAEILGLDIDKDAVATYNLNLGRLGCRAERQAAAPAGRAPAPAGPTAAGGRRTSAGARDS